MGGKESIVINQTKSNEAFGSDMPKINGATQLDRPAPVQQLCQVFWVGFIIDINPIIIKRYRTDYDGGSGTLN